MGFMEDAAEDLDEVFFDEDFFATWHNFDGKDILVVVDEDELEEMKRKWKDEVNKSSVLLYVQAKDMERKLAINSSVEFDGKLFFVNNLRKQDGVWKMLLGRNQV